MIMTTTPIQDMQIKFINHGLVTFGLNLRHHVIKGVNKKKLLPPFGFNNFTVNSYPRADRHNNALGMCTGKSNNIFVIDVDEPNDWLLLLNACNVDPEAPELRTCQQHSANGGFHLFFQYNEEKMKHIHGTSVSFGNKWALDIRTNGNFILVNPSHFKNDVVDWSYRWEPQRSLFDMKPLPLPDFLITALNKADKERGNGGGGGGAKQAEKAAADLAKLRQCPGPFFSVAQGGKMKGVFSNWGEFLIAVMHQKAPVFDLFSHLDDAFTFLNRRHPFNPNLAFQEMYLVISYEKKKWTILKIRPTFSMYHCYSNQSEPLHADLETEALDHVLERTRAYQKCHKDHLATKNIKTVKTLVHVNVCFSKSAWNYQDDDLQINVLKNIPGRNIWLDSLEIKLDQEKQKEKDRRTF